MKITMYENVVAAADAFTGTLTDGVECELARIGETGIYYRTVSRCSVIRFHIITEWGIPRKSGVFAS